MFVPCAKCRARHTRPKHTGWTKWQLRGPPDPRLAKGHLPAVTHLWNHQRDRNKIPGHTSPHHTASLVTWGHERCHPISPLLLPCPLHSPCRAQDTIGVGSAEATHSITTLCPDTTVVFSGAATMSTSCPLVAARDPGKKTGSEHLWSPVCSRDTLGRDEGSRHQLGAVSPATRRAHLHRGSRDQAGQLCPPSAFPAFPTKTSAQGSEFLVPALQRCDLRQISEHLGFPWGEAGWA